MTKKLEQNHIRQFRIIFKPKNLNHRGNLNSVIHWVRQLNLEETGDMVSGPPEAQLRTIRKKK